jgi:hypothetical protein
MTLYNAELVDVSTRRRFMSILLQYRAYDVLLNLLDGVTIKLLLHAYPVESYEWLTGNPPPADLLLHPSWHMDPRGTVIHLWKRLAAEISANNHHERLPDGAQSINWGNQEIADAIVQELTSFPFEQAISTWFAAWKEWIQVSNTDELLRNFQQVQLEVDVNNMPRMMAEWVEYQYRLGGW